MVAPGVKRTMSLMSLMPLRSIASWVSAVTLIGTAYNIAPVGAWFPPFIETAIAVSIVYMALENIVGASLRRRWIIAGLFGLVHGFGFADILREQLQFAGSHLLVSLFSFNVGIEIGQLAVLCVFVPALALLFRGAMSGRMGIIVVSAIVANIAWQWMVQRGFLGQIGQHFGDLDGIGTGSYDAGLRLGDARRRDQLLGLRDLLYRPG